MIGQIASHIPPELEQTSLNATRPSPTGTPSRAYTNNLRSYPLAERDYLLPSAAAPPP